jgi:hypothetical protein
MTPTAWGACEVFLYNWQSLIAGGLGLLAGLIAFAAVQSARAAGGGRGDAGSQPDLDVGQHRFQSGQGTASR